MSYILVTYGYNQYSLFNIKTSTPTLIDKIKEISFKSISDKLDNRDKALQKEIESTINEEEKMHKVISATEQDLQTEEDKYAEAVKQLEAKKKREEMEQKKKEAMAKDAKGKGKKEEKKVQEKKKTKNEKKTGEENEISNQAVLDLKDKIAKLNNELNTLTNNKNIYIDKKNKLQELIAIYKKKFKEKMTIKIDLVDAKGEKINIYTRGDIYANEYLAEKTVYELHSFNVVNTDEKDSKKNTKKDFKKDKKTTEDKNKEKEKEKENKDNKENKAEKEEKEIEYVLEPVKIDGYCFRSIKEDEELEGTGGATGKDKKTTKKK